MSHKTACKLDHTTAGFWVDESINRFGNLLLYNFQKFKDSKARALVGGCNISQINMFVIIRHLKQSSLLYGWTPKKCTENLKTHSFCETTSQLASREWRGRFPNSAPVLSAEVHGPVHNDCVHPGNENLSRGHGSATGIQRAVTWWWNKKHQVDQVDVYGWNWISWWIDPLVIKSGMHEIYWSSG